MDRLILRHSLVSLFFFHKNEKRDSSTKHICSGLLNAAVNRALRLKS